MYLEVKNLKKSYGAGGSQRLLHGCLLIGYVPDAP